MPIILINSITPCFIEYGSLISNCSNSEPVILSCSLPCNMLFKVWGIKTERELLPLPYICGIRINGSGHAQDHYGTEDLCVETMGCSAIIWSDLIEIRVSPQFVIQNYREPEIVDSHSFMYKGTPAKAELYRDDFMRLIVSSERLPEPVSIALGRCDEGSLGSYDTGKAKLLSILIKGSVKMAGDKLERMILLNENAEAALDVTGDRVTIADGYPQAIRRLGEYSGIIETERFNYEKGIFVSIGKKRANDPELNETGESSVFTALKFIELIGLKETERARSLLADELDKRLSDEEIYDFLGDIGGVFPHPTEIIKENKNANNEDDKRIKIGVIRDSHSTSVSSDNSGFCCENAIIPREIVFTIHKGRIADVELME